MDVNTIRPLLSATELADAEWWDPHNRDAVRMAFLKRYALTQDFGNSTSPYVRDAVLRPLGYRGSSGDAFSFLVELEMFDEFANLHQLRATHLGGQPALPTPITPTAWPTYHTVYTIDDASTTEVDDGISVEWQTGGSSRPNNWVFVHIADPTSWIPVDHEVDRHARDRVSTIYLPETIVPMLQPSIYRHFSLEPRRDNYAMTFAFKISSVDGAIEDYTITPSSISRVKKLTYHQVDAVLAQAPGGQASRHTSQSLLADQDKEALLHLHELALLRKRWRLSQGAKTIILPKPLVKVINTPHMRRVSVSVEEQMTPARELVAEMMIATNQVAGLYAAQHGLFVPYRHQAAPHEVDPDLLRELDGLPEHIKYAELVRHMQTAEISLVPKRHTSLGTLRKRSSFRDMGRR
ncbi:exoribonuclease II [Acanthamoeba castellanii str. Neff]|uniref:Exoribonuclease II n=1 Tax=Acanthamoeba castellanii (strain ATCC 30010 / Neff) TaxID=1257118 RepID=L8GMU9_ACACF|nr:exoribonuclease II [Acanthamoeba castellanii str. Neff]ELR14307.1 exoribonuclease II [Acanthamoeba castellanii str. Neff]